MPSLTSLVYRLNGIELPRDADLQSEDEPHWAELYQGARRPR